MSEKQRTHKRRPKRMGQRPNSETQKNKQVPSKKKVSPLMQDEQLATPQKVKAKKRQPVKKLSGQKCRRTNRASAVGSKNKPYSVATKKSGKGQKPAPFSMKRFLKNHRDTLLLIGLAAAIGLFFVHYGSHRVDGQSMEPTFHNKDRILINKGEAPTRYAIVTFIPKDAPEDSYVKRVIGLPGDQIWVEGTALFLLPKESKTEDGETTTAVNESDSGDTETPTSLPDSTIKITVSEAVAAELTSLSEIPKDRYFVQGDNRLHSSDSRSFGLITSEQIEGVVVSRYYPFGAT